MKGKGGFRLAGSIDVKAGFGIGLWFSWTWCLFFGRSMGEGFQVEALAASQLYMALTFGVVACVLGFVARRDAFHSLYRLLNRGGVATILVEEGCIVAGSLLLFLFPGSSVGLDPLPLAGALCAGVGFSVLTVRWIRAFSRIPKGALQNTTTFGMVIGALAFALCSYLVSAAAVAFSCVLPVVSSLLARSCLMKVPQKADCDGLSLESDGRGASHARGRLVLCVIYFLCAVSIGVSRMIGNDFVADFSLHVAGLFAGIVVLGLCILGHYLRVGAPVTYAMLLRLASVIICVGLVVGALRPSSWVALSIALCVAGWSLFEVAFYSVCARMANPLREWGFEKACFTVRAAAFFGIAFGSLASTFACLALDSSRGALEFSAIGIAVLMFAATFVIPKIEEFDKGYADELVEIERGRREEGRAQRPAPEVVAANEERLDALDAVCGAIAQDRRLTKREAEVMGYLLRGRNAASIEAALSLSNSTVKTHIRHIYEKCGVHSHQELLDVAESYLKS